MLCLFMGNQSVGFQPSKFILINCVGSGWLESKFAFDEGQSFCLVRVKV